ncbi:OmpP1/FadL family transporter, partial [Xanthovirga aplysinae]|uniref:OmpP1/FadL family transporter n=1 Tax=Xanthovirga aplysinae TaxID=2529853 RepID=UPI0012BB6F29
VGSNLFASGYQVVLKGNRQLAMGNIGVAGFRPDASSIFFNPGALAMMENNSLIVGFNPIFSHIAYADYQENSSYTSQTNNPMGTPFHFYASWGMQDSPLRFGLGVFTPFGSTVQWEDGWKGENLLTELSLQSIYIQPTISYRINDNWSVGAGLDYAIGSVNLQKSINNIPDATAELDGKAEPGFGYNLGLYYQADRFTAGISYRSAIKMKVKGGDALFHVPDALRGSLPADVKFDAELPLPSSLNVGASYNLTSAFTLATEINYVGWSKYEALEFDYDNETDLLQDTSSPRDYKDSWTFHLGGEYRLNNLALRAGTYYDLTPVQDGYQTPETPDANRLGLTAGFGYSFGNLNVDVSFLWIEGQEREQTLGQAQSAGTIDSVRGIQDVLPGTYKSRAFIPGVSLSYNF